MKEKAYLVTVKDEKHYLSDREPKLFNTRNEAEDHIKKAVKWILYHYFFADCRVNDVKVLKHYLKTYYKYRDTRKHKWAIYVYPEIEKYLFEEKPKISDMYDRYDCYISEWIDTSKISFDRLLAKFRSEKIPVHFKIEEKTIL